MFVMLGLVRGLSEGELGLAAGVEGREAWHRLRKGKRGLGLGRTKKIIKKKKKRKKERRQRRRRGRTREPKKKKRENKRR